jgi:hypothetical protein
MIPTFHFKVLKKYQGSQEWETKKQPHWGKASAFLISWKSFQRLLKWKSGCSEAGPKQDFTHSHKLKLEFRATVTARTS